MRRSQRRRMSAVYSLCRECCRVGEYEVRYRLRYSPGESGSRFSVSVRMGREVKILLAGNDLGVAWTLYCRLLSGGVTPCCAQDVQADFFTECS